MNVGMNLAPYRDPGRLPHRIAGAIAAILGATVLQLCLYALHPYDYRGEGAWLLTAGAMVYFAGAALYVDRLYRRGHDFNPHRMGAFVSLLLIGMLSLAMTPAYIPALFVLSTAVLCSIPVFRRHGFIWAFVTVVLGLVITLAALNGGLAGLRVFFG